MFDFFPLSVKGFQSKLPFTKARWKLEKLYLGTFCHGGVLLVVVIVVVVVAVVVVVDVADRRQLLFEDDLTRTIKNNRHL